MSERNEIDSAIYGSSASLTYSSIASEYSQWPVVLKIEHPYGFAFLPTCTVDCCIYNTSALYARRAMPSRITVHSVWGNGGYTLCSMRYRYYTWTTLNVAGGQLEPVTPSVKLWIFADSKHFVYDSIRRRQCLRRSIRPRALRLASCDS